MDKATISLDGREYVVIPRSDYDRLQGLANLPPYPKADKQGNMPAVEFGRASLARKIIRARVEAGLSQKDLAKRAGIRVETLCRIETGKHTASAPTLRKLERALGRT
jgi:DNA-binding XRE family transcriptional regulator